MDSVAVREITTLSGRSGGAGWAYRLREAPDSVAMTAVGIAISGGGALSKFETTT